MQIRAAVWGCHGLRDKQLGSDSWTVSPSGKREGVEPTLEAVWMFSLPLGELPGLGGTSTFLSRNYF